MKILVVCQYYYPEPFRITDICEWFVQQGHEVQVVTGIPNYPLGVIYDGYKHGSRKNEVINGVKVHRCFTIGRRTGAFYRLLNYFSFAFSSTMYTSFMKDDYDVVFVNQLSPVMMASAAIAYKKKHNKKLVLYCLDLWPESLVVGGITRDSIIYKLFHNISKRIYKKADKILISSKSFAKYFKDEFQINHTEYLPQYAEAIFAPELCVKTPDDTIDLMFAGNVGTAQSVETIIYAAKETQDITNLRWHIVGDGSELDNMKELAANNNINSVIFHGRKPLEEMPRYYSMADAMLVTMQKNPILSMTVPGKVQTYIAAGKPIIGAIDGETAAVIQEAGCGLCCGAEDYIGLSKIVREFVGEYKVKNYSLNALKYSNVNYEKEKTLARLMQHMMDIV